MVHLTYHVDLVHDGLETRQDTGEEDGADCQGRVAIITHGQQVVSSIGTGDDDDLVAVVVLFAILAAVGRSGGLDLDITTLLGDDVGVVGGQDLLVVGFWVGRGLEDLALDGVEPSDHNGLGMGGVDHGYGASGKDRLGDGVGKESKPSWNQCHGGGTR